MECKQIAMQKIVLLFFREIEKSYLVYQFLFGEAPPFHQTRIYQWQVRHHC